MRDSVLVMLRQLRHYVTVFGVAYSAEDQCVSRLLTIAALCARHVYSSVLGQGQSVVLASPFRVDLFERAHVVERIVPISSGCCRDR